MKPVALKCYPIEGFVSSHNGHLCSGHEVSGIITKPMQNKVFVNSIPVVVAGATGPTNCPCHGCELKDDCCNNPDSCTCGPFVCVEASRKFFISGKPVVRLGDKVDIHGTGTGQVAKGHPKIFTT